MPRSTGLKTAFVGAIVLPTVVQAQVIFATIARNGASGTVANGLPAGAYFSSFNGLSIDRHGSVLVRASGSHDLNGPSRGVWHLGTPNSASPQFLVYNSPTTGLPAGANWLEVDRTAFTHDLAGSSYINYSASFSTNPQGGGFRQALWHGPAGNQQMLAYQGMAASEIGTGVTIGSIGDGSPSINPRMYAGGNSISFVGLLDGSGINSSNRSTIWAATSSSGLALVARQGDQAVGLPAGSVYGDVVTRLNMSDSGAIAFYSTYTVGGVVQGQGVWSGRPTGTGGAGLQLFAKSGDAISSSESGVVFGQFVTPKLNSQGRVSFSATLQGAGVGSSNDVVMVSGTPGNLQVVAREGDQAPGVPVGLKYGNGFNILSVADTGRTLFRVQLSDSTSCIYSADPGQSPQLVMRSTQPVPGYPGSTLVSVGAVMNTEGIITWDINAIDPLGRLGSHSILAPDPSGNMTLVAKTGQLIEYAPGVFDTIDELTYLTTLGEDGRQVFSASGTLLISARLRNAASQSNMHILTARVVPAPSAGLCVLLGSLFATRRRSRSR